MKRSAAFTLIELLVVLMIAGLLTAMAAPKALEIIRRSSLTKGTAAIGELASAARIMAQRHDPPPASELYRCFGVIVVDDGTGPAWAGLTWGSNNPPLPADLLMRKQTRWQSWGEYAAASDELDASGASMPVMQISLRDLEVHRPAAGSPMTPARLTGSWGWLVQYNSGAVIDSASPGAKWTDVGLNPMLVLRRGDQLAAAMAIYAAGVSNAATLR